MKQPLSKTPNTDRAVIKVFTMGVYDNYVPALVSREIEKELRTLQASHLELVMENGDLEKQLAAVTKERDELQEQAARRSMVAAASRRSSPVAGFTLIELLTVVAILAIAFCVIAPAVSRSIRHARASIATTREFHAQRLAAAWDGDCTNEIFSCHNYKEMTNTTELP